MSPSSGASWSVTLGRLNQRKCVEDFARFTLTQLMIATVLAIVEPGLPSIFTLHFETLIPQPAPCNARARIYSGIRRATVRQTFNLELSYDGPT